jgi:hypothetical protein
VNPDFAKLIDKLSTSRVGVFYVAFYMQTARKEMQNLGLNYGASNRIKYPDPIKIKTGTTDESSTLRDAEFRQDWRRGCVCHVGEIACKLFFSLFSLDRPHQALNLHLT